MGDGVPIVIMGNEAYGIVKGFEEDGEVENVLKIGDRGKSSILCR